MSRPALLAQNANLNHLIVPRFQGVNRLFVLAFEDDAQRASNKKNYINFPHKLLLTNRQIPNLCKAFANNSLTDIKLSKSQLSKMIQSGGFLGRLLGSFLKTGLPLIKNVIKPLAKSILIALGLTAAASQQMWEYIKKY